MVFSLQCQDRLELRGQHVAAPGIRLCTSHPSGVFLKIGGRLNETTLGHLA